MEQPPNEHKFQELEMADTKLLAAAKHIERNILFQILIIFIGFSYCIRPEILDESDLPFAKGGILIPVIVAPLLLYFFMRFGFSFYHYYTLRYDLDRKIRSVYQDPERWHYRIFTNESIAETMYIFFKRRDPLFNEHEDAYPLRESKISFSRTIAAIHIILLSMNHSLSLFFLLKYIPPLYVAIPSALVWLAMICLCYRDYYLMKDRFHGVGKIQWSIGILSVVLITVLILFLY